MSAPARALLAGASGTLALNAVTYVDMALRGRPASDVPERGAEQLARRLGVTLGRGRARRHRRKAAGHLLGYASGIGSGVAWTAADPLLRRLPRPAAAAVAGIGTMAATNASNVAMGLAADPRRWSASQWLEDLVPHLAYGAATVAALEAVRPQRHPIAA